jgi:hypothetical protein
MFARSFGDVAWSTRAIDAPLSATLRRINPSHRDKFTHAPSGIAQCQPHPTSQVVGAQEAFTLDIANVQTHTAFLHQSRPPGLLW